jgi:hypothetical protein
MQHMQRLCCIAAILLSTDAAARLCARRALYSAIQKDGLNFVRLYFLNYTWYVNNLHNI